MSNYPVGRRPRSADPQSTLRLAALTAVSAGVVLLAAAAFVLSYSGIHAVALQAGVSPRLAKLYPVIFDAMLVIAGAAAMALRGAGWWSRFYAWACLIALLAAVAIGDAVHATGTALPERASRAAVAITPWVLLLLAFGLLLTMLRHFRKARTAVAARQEARAAAASGGQPGEANGAATGRTTVTWAAAGSVGTSTATEGRSLPPPKVGLDTLLGPRPAPAPAIEAPNEADAVDTDAGQLDDPVSYGEETGYVHPDSYRDEGEYSPHGDSGGPESYAGPGYLGQGEPAEDHARPADYGPRHRAAGAGGDGDQGPEHAEPEAGQASAGQALPGQAQAVQAQPVQAQPGQAQPVQAQAGQAQPVQAQAGQAQPVQAQAGQAQPVQAQAGQADAAPGDDPAGGHAGDDASGETAAAESPGLERLRSTPTRPEE